ncbi:hypothetical protein ACA910_003056 [Epithemia clementina (nom. ined.)]
MNTADWAEDAHIWFESYHLAISQGTFAAKDFFFDLAPVANNNDDDDDDQCNKNNKDDHLHVWERYRCHPLLKNVSLDDWQPGDFDLLEQMRGWQPLLRKLPKVPEYRLLTLIRRNLYLPLSDKENFGLVSRHQWTLMEALRWRQGYYQKSQVVEAICEATLEDDDNNNTNHKNTTSNQQFTLFQDPNLQVCSFSDKSEVDDDDDDDVRGRFVVWKGQTPAHPGQKLVTTRPFCVALYDLSVDASTFCFHCAKQKKPNASVRELTLICPKCQVWSYCSRACKQAFQSLHELECAKLPQLMDQSTALGVPCFKAQLVYRAVLSKQLLQNEEAWDQLLQLENHARQYNKAGNDDSFLLQATRFSEWMKGAQLIPEDGIHVSTLVHLFLSINVNAIGLGLGAVGLFPGVPSMFNHSCLENATHSWNDKDGFLEFRAVEKIAMNQECCISYVSYLERETSQRNEPLRKYKFFTCTCARCKSPSEGGRLDAVHEWKECMVTLERGETNNVMDIYRRLVELAEILFPSYFVTKGWAMEECARALMQDTRCWNEALDLLQRAHVQYEACRGKESELVRRVDDAIAEVKAKIVSIQAPAKATDVVGRSKSFDLGENDFDHNEDRAQACHKVLLEVKTFEPPGDWNDLAARVRSTQLSNNPGVSWSPTYRIYELGFGIQTLVLCCNLQESAVTSVELSEEIKTCFDDEIQSVDLIDVQDHAY